LAAITITTYLITQNEKRKTLKQKLNKASKEQEKIDQFFEENSNAKKELDDEIKLWQTKPKKSNPNAKRVRCATPHVRRVKEKIYDKYNK
jgi:septal ring factor EnvC (AmiA/AmiB activator)